MKLLVLDSSGLVASVALIEDDQLIAEYTTGNTVLQPQDLHINRSPVQAVPPVRSSFRSHTYLLHFPVLSHATACIIYHACLELSILFLLFILFTQFTQF